MASDSIESWDGTSMPHFFKASESISITKTGSGAYSEQGLARAVEAGELIEVGDNGKA